MSSPQQEVGHFVIEESQRDSYRLLMSLRNVAGRHSSQDCPDADRNDASRASFDQQPIAAPAPAVFGN
jgi:hypothetical protein